MSAPGHQREHNQTATTQASEADGRVAAEPADAGQAPEQADVERAPQMAEPVVEIDERRAKMERLRAEGIDPYPHVRLPDRTPVARVLASHDPAQLSQGEHRELPYHLAGRLTSRRRHGKTAFLDLRDLFGTRAKIVAAIRDWLNERDFVEVETPALQSLAGGAGSRPFITHHNALDRDLYLRISVELFLNRAIVGGLENVYDMGKAFRNEGISYKHSPEFTILEFMLAYADYYDVADATEEMFRDVAQRVLGRTEIQRDGQTIDLAKPWRRTTMREVILEQTGVDFMGDDRAAVTRQLVELLEERVHPATTWAELTHAVYTKLIEPTLIQPTHVFDFPLEPFPITKRHAEYRELGEHFDAVIGGVELVSGDTELNDPVDQWQRFVEQRQRRTVDDEDMPHPNDEEYARAIEHGYAPTAGGGMGVDRLVMILTERESLREVIPFPIVRELR